MKFAFSRIELIDLLKAWFAISVAFTIASVGLQFNLGVIVLFGVVAFSAGLGFLLHELAHKIVAQHYGAWAEFRADNRMLLLMLIISVFGFIFAAPGAVFHSSNTTFQQRGKISVAGPMTNIVLALFFLGLSFIIGPVALYGAQINAWLALFNMLPFGPLDGTKVLAWSPAVWGITGLAALALVIFANYFPIM